jgi:hypothetical protein
MNLVRAAQCRELTRGAERLDKRRTAFVAVTLIQVPGKYKQIGPGAPVHDGPCPAFFVKQNYLGGDGRGTARKANVRLTRGVLVSRNFPAALGFGNRIHLLEDFCWGIESSRRQVLAEMYKTRRSGNQQDV